MPNTLAHFAVHTPVTRALFRNVDPRWLLLGCVLSDVPWILQRAAWTVWPAVDRYDLRLYAIVQASLFTTLFLAGALAALSARRGRTFAVLALGSVLHLLLDACQHKWGNAVHLLAPISWESASFSLFWPEDWPTLALTGLGLPAFVWALRFPGRVGLRIGRPWLAVGLFAAYALVPFAFQKSAQASDTHSIQTLRRVGTRAGTSVALDRAHYEAGKLTTFANEALAVAGDKPLLDHPAQVSVRAVFTDNTTVRVVAFHEHTGFRRDWASYIGLGLVAFAWLCPRRRRDP